MSRASAVAGSRSRTCSSTSPRAASAATSSGSDGAPMTSSSHRRRARRPRRSGRYRRLDRRGEAEQLPRPHRPALLSHHAVGWLRPFGPRLRRARPAPVSTRRAIPARARVQRRPDRHALRGDRARLRRGSLRAQDGDHRGRPHLWRRHVGGVPGRFPGRFVGAAGPDRPGTGRAVAEHHSAQRGTRPQARARDPGGVDVHGRHSGRHGAGRPQRRAPAARMAHAVRGRRRGSRGRLPAAARPPAGIRRSS